MPKVTNWIVYIRYIVDNITQKTVVIELDDSVPGINTKICKDLKTEVTYFNNNYSIFTDVYPVFGEMFKAVLLNNINNNINNRRYVKNCIIQHLFCVSCELREETNTCIVAYTLTNTTQDVMDGIEKACDKYDKPFGYKIIPSTSMESLEED